MMVPLVRSVERWATGEYGRLSAMLLLLAALLPIVMAQPTGAAGDPKSGTILVKELNMRSGPGKHNPPIATLRRGARVLVLSYEGEWVRILFDNQTGFIMNRERYLRIDEPSSEATEFVDATDAQRRPADTFSRELEQSQQKVASYSKAESAVITALDETEQALNTARKKVARLSADLEALAQRMDALQQQYQEIEQRSARNETYVAGRLAALYKLSWLGKFNVLASADSMFDFFANKRTLEHILAHDETVMAELAKDKADMQALLAQLAARRDEKQAASEDLAQRIETMKIEQAKRESLLKAVRSKKSLQLAAIDALKASVRDLDRTLAAFQSEPRPAPSAVPTVTVKEKPFAELKGLLMMPVKGRIISFFGHHKDSRFNVTNFQSGINIKADRGEPIRAVYSGKTLFSDWFKGFGNMIIIDHGDHYYTVYAHLEEQFKKKGDPVEAGEVIATVGDTGSLTGSGLHFEVRHHGKPMNPLGWIKKG